MTVTYGDQSFLRLLFRWRGSVWKSVYKEYIVFLILYALIQVVYRLVLHKENDTWGQPKFERYVMMSQKMSRLIPITFLLGFYVSNVVNRWWQQLNQVSWPDKFLLFITANMNGDEPEVLQIRRTFARYCNLLAALVWKEISLKIKKRFPTDHHLVQAGLMTDEEYELFQNATSTHGRWFIPVSWSINLLAKCKHEGRISDYAFQKLVDEMYAFRSTAAMLTIYDWISIPLVYTQVVTVATYGYFAFNLVGSQALRNDAPALAGKHDYVDIYFPLFTSLEFVFYIGWLKVGEELRCPFGEGDEDFNMNYVLDRNIHVGNQLVDELQRHRPSVTVDRFATEKYPMLPHTKASYKVRDTIPNWRLAKAKISAKDQALIEAANEMVNIERGTVRRGEPTLTAMTPLTEVTPLAEREGEAGER